MSRMRIRKSRKFFTGETNMSRVKHLFAVVLAALMLWRLICKFYCQQRCNTCKRPSVKKLVGVCVCYRFFLKKSHFNKDLKHKRNMNNRILWIPIFLFAETECGHCALQNIYNFIANLAILDRSRSIRYMRG